MTQTEQELYDYINRECAILTPHDEIATNLVSMLNITYEEALAVVKDIAEKQLDGAKRVMFISTELEKGKTKNEIVHSLMIDGFSEENAEQVINSVQEMMKTGEAAMKKNSFPKRIIASVFPIIFMIMAFALMNGLIYGAQEAYYWNDTKKCDDMKVRAELIKIKIKKVEDFFVSNEKQLDEVNQLAHDIKQGYSTDVSKYKEILALYYDNAELLEDYKIKYNTLFTTHNQIVDEYNELSQKAYRRWWLLPIPLPSKHTSL